MNSQFSEEYNLSSNPFSRDSAVPEDLEEDDDDEIHTETLMEALSQYITIDEEAQAIYGCGDDFRHTREILSAHGQEESVDEVIALLNKQGAFCDCDVLTKSTIDLVFLEADALEYEDEEEEEEA